MSNHNPRYPTQNDSENASRGRPRIDPEEPAVNLTVRLPPKLYDAAYKSSRTTGAANISEWLRATIRQSVRR